MSLFTPRPHELAVRAIRAVNKWWLSFDKQQDFFYLFDFGKIRVYLFGSTEIGTKNYQARYNTKDPLPSEAGFVRKTDSEKYMAEYEIWLKATKTPAGNLCIDEWGAGHELMHCFNMEWAERFGNPDDVIKAEFYG